VHFFLVVIFGKNLVSIFFVKHFVGDVSTVCEIKSPSSVAITTNQVILVSSALQIHKIVQIGIYAASTSPLFPFSLLALPSLLHTYSNFRGKV
jgi:hypothetical protein